MVGWKGDMMALEAVVLTVYERGNGLVGQMENDSAA